MIYSQEVEHMCVVKKGPNHGPAPIPEEGKWVKAKEVIDISGLTHGVGWCAPNKELVSCHSTSKTESYKKRSSRPSVVRV